MKRKIVLILVILFISTIFFNVKAEEVQVKTLIPVDTSATVKTEKFSYNNFSYSSHVDSIGNTIVTFDSVENLSLSKVPVSINLLLFDENKLNIGFLTYCSDKDISSNYAGFKLTANQSAPFSIRVTDKYFAEGYLPANVKYIAVLDENKYCQVGGYDKYKGLTIDQIANGFVENNRKAFTINSIITDLMEKFGIVGNGHTIIMWFINIIIVFTIYMVIAKIINTLNRKMYAKNTSLAYIPCINIYVAVKLAFGNIIGTIYLIVYLISGLLYFVIGPAFAIIITVVGIIGFIIDIVKLITKKYDLLYYEPAIKVKNYNNLSGSSKNDKKSSKNSENLVSNDGNQALDLSYSDRYDTNIDSSTSDFNVSSGIGVVNNNTSLSNNDSNNNSSMTNLFSQSNSVQTSSISESTNYNVASSDTSSSYLATNYGEIKNDENIEPIGDNMYSLPQSTVSPVQTVPEVSTSSPLTLDDDIDDDINDDLDDDISDGEEESDLSKFFN